MTNDQPFRFSSEYCDTETDLIYYNYRYYSPELGSWLSRDPIEEKGGLNLYGFVGNDGVNKWDYLGMMLLTTKIGLIFISRFNNKLVRQTNLLLGF